jgi:hypothetical protein
MDRLENWQQEMQHEFARLATAVLNERQGKDVTVCGDNTWFSSPLFLSVDADDLDIDEKNKLAEEFAFDPKLDVNSGKPYPLKANGGPMGETGPSPHPDGRGTGNKEESKNGVTFYLDIYVGYLRRLVFFEARNSFHDVVALGLKVSNEVVWPILAVFKTVVVYAVWIMFGFVRCLTMGTKDACETISGNIPFFFGLMLWTFVFLRGISCWFSAPSERHSTPLRHSHTSNPSNRYLPGRSQNRTIREEPIDEEEEDDEDHFEWQPPPRQQQQEELRVAHFTANLNQITNPTIKKPTKTEIRKQKLNAKKWYQTTLGRR